MHRATSRVLFPIALSGSYNDDNSLRRMDDKKNIQNDAINTDTLSTRGTSFHSSSSLNCTDLSELSHQKSPLSSPTSVTSYRSPVMDSGLKYTPAKKLLKNPAMATPQSKTTLSTPTVGSFFERMGTSQRYEYDVDGISTTPSSLYSRHSIDSHAVTPEHSCLEVNFLDTFSKTVWQQVEKQRLQHEYYAFADAELQRQLAKDHAIENIASLLGPGDLFVDEDIYDGKYINKHNVTKDGDSPTHKDSLAATCTPSFTASSNSEVTSNIDSNGNVVSVLHKLKSSDLITDNCETSVKCYNVTEGIDVLGPKTPDVTRNKATPITQHVQAVGGLQDVRKQRTKETTDSPRAVSQALHSSGPSKKELYKVTKLSRADIARVLERNEQYNNNNSHRNVQKDDGKELRNGVGSSPSASNNAPPTLECLADLRVVTLMANERRLRAQAVKKCAEDLFKCLKGVPDVISKQILNNDNGITAGVIEKYVQRIRSGRMVRSQRAVINRQVKRLKKLHIAINTTDNNTAFNDNRHTGVPNSPSATTITDNINGIKKTVLTGKTKTTKNSKNVIGTGNNVNRRKKSMTSLSHLSKIDKEMKRIKLIRMSLRMTTVNNTNNNKQYRSLRNPMM